MVQAPFITNFRSYGLEDQHGLQNTAEDCANFNKCKFLLKWCFYLLFQKRHIYIYNTHTHTHTYISIYMHNWNHTEPCNIKEHLIPLGELWNIFFFKREQIGCNITFICRAAFMLIIAPRSFTDQYNRRQQQKAYGPV